MAIECSDGISVSFSDIDDIPDGISVRLSDTDDIPDSISVRLSDIDVRCNDAEGISMASSDVDNPDDMNGDVRSEAEISFYTSSGDMSGLTKRTDRVLFEIRFSFVVLGEFGNDECTAVSRKRLIYSEGVGTLVENSISSSDSENENEERKKRKHCVGTRVENSLSNLWHFRTHLTDALLHGHWATVFLDSVAT
eukprot:Em0022g805a